MKRKCFTKNSASTIVSLSAFNIFLSMISVFSFPVFAESTSGSVKLDTSVGESISMSITGNADGTICTEAGFDSCSTFGSLLPNSYASTSSLIKVFTNSSSGYSLSVKAKEHTALQLANNNSTGSIPTGVLTNETGGQGIWSYKTDTTGIKPNWTAITTEDTVIKGTSVYEAEENETTVTYGLSTNDSQSTGRYSTTLVYTATAPNETSVVEPTAPLIIHLNEGIYGVYIKADRLDGGAVSLVTEDGETVEIALGRSYYLIPLYESGYTLDTITPTGGTTSVGTNGYYYYKSSSQETNEVTLTGKTLTSALTNSSLPAMQTLTSANCPAIPTAVQDNRDNSVYYIQKLADGNCWTLENLRLGGSSTMELNSSNTNLAANTTFTLPASGTDNFTNSTGYTNAAMNTGSSTTTVTGYGAGRNLVGNYYNYCAASAGTICADSNSQDDEFNVCPANWTIPSGGPDGQYGKLATSLDPTIASDYFSGDLSTIYRYHLSALLSGYFYPSETHGENTRGDFWSATQNETYTTNNYRFYINSNSVNPHTNNNGRYYGFSIRCLLK